MERVQKGERFIITRHGKPVAELAPYRGHDADAARSAVAEMRRMRVSHVGRQLARGIYNGFNFRFAIDAGAEQGRDRARFILDNHLQRRLPADRPADRL